jgi:hypothetical protein
LKYERDNTYHPPLNTYSGLKDNTTQALAISRVYSQ